jgi:glycosyltransferase involved in cell wall biosynthesis
VHSSLPAAPNQFPIPGDSSLDISIVIPARNEEAAVGDCLQSLTGQTGVRFEIIVVDDGSTDQTRKIAQSFSGVRVISSGPLPEGWTGKNNAIVAGAKEARANWLLFTDADTVHLPGSLARALNEAKPNEAKPNEAKTGQADLLSYSPEQLVKNFSERAVMPLIFAELAAQYPPQKVRDQHSGVVAANGQYILVRRAAYEAVGGHAAVGAEILEDVALARLFRNAGYRIHFRYGGDAVRTRMYRNWQQLREGWTKNLALLFPHPEYLAFQIMIWWLAAWSALGIGIVSAMEQHFAWIALVAIWLLLYSRISKANFAPANNLIAAAFGPPILAYLLQRSKKAKSEGKVSWKGRTYKKEASDGNREMLPTPNANIENRILKAGS